MGEDSNVQPPADIKGFNIRRDTAAFIWETIKIVVISLAIILPVRYYLIQPFFVKGQSMEENFDDGDYLIVDEISYYLGQPHRGDVVVFHYPEDPSQFYIKRIIGLPGETVEVKNNKVTIYNIQYAKGLVLKEDYIASYQQTLGNLKKVLGPDEYFVLGDNRLRSSDSRYWGTLPRKLIVGRALLRLWPLTKVIKVPRVEYVAQ